MGAIVDRSEEHLGVTDVGIIQLRRRPLKEATNLLEVRRTVCPVPWGGLPGSRRGFAAPR